MSLVGKAVSGFKWNTGAKIFVVGIQFLTIAILARLLTPEEFGLVGMATVFIGLAQTLADFGLSAAIVHRQEATKSQLSTLYWFNIITGCALALLLIIISPLIVRFYQERLLYPVIIFSAISFPIASIGQQFGTLLSKNLKFKNISFIDCCAILIGSVTSIVLALNGLGGLSLVLGNVARTSIQTILNLYFAFRFSWFPSLYFNIHEVRYYIKFGYFQMGQRLLNYSSANIDYLIIGRILGPTQLGYYTLAYRLMMFPIWQINPIFTNVAFPIFSRVQDDNRRLRSGYQRMLSYISLLAFPMYAGMFVLAEPFVQVVYGSSWLPAVPVIRVFCFLGILIVLGNPIGSLLLAKGRADWGFWLNVFAFAGRSIANLIGVQWGIIGVAIGRLVFDFIFLFPFGFYLRWKLIKMRVVEYWISIRTSLITTLIMLLTLIVIELIWSLDNPLVTLLRDILVGFLIYIFIYWLLDRQKIQEIWELAHLPNLSGLRKSIKG